MSRALRSLFILALLATTSFAAEPKAVIKGKSSVPANFPVILDARESVNDPDKPLVWKWEWKGSGPEPLYLTFDKDGRSNVVLMVPDPPSGLLRFILVAKAGGDADADVFDVRVGKGSDPVPPEPGPHPPVPPPQPPGPVDDPDPDAYRLGRDFTATVMGDLSSRYEKVAADPSWKTTAEAAEKLRAARDGWENDLDALLKTAGSPVASEITRRFGKTSDQPAPEPTLNGLRQFWFSFSKGARDGRSD